MLGKPAQDKALLCEVLNEVLQVSIVRDALQTVTTEDLSTPQVFLSLVALFKNFPFW